MLLPLTKDGNLESGFLGYYVERNWGPPKMVFNQHERKQMHIEPHLFFTSLAESRGFHIQMTGMEMGPENTKAFSPD